MQREQFEALVEEAVAGLSPKLLSKLDNVALVVEWQPSPAKLRELEMSVADSLSLYGLYEGISQTERVASSYDAVLPDKITIYQRALEHSFPDPEELKQQIAVTVKHEIAHHFGLDHEQLDEIGLS